MVNGPGEFERRNPGQGDGAFGSGDPGASRYEDRAPQNPNRQNAAYANPYNAPQWHAGMMSPVAQQKRSSGNRNKIIIAIAAIAGVVAVGAAAYKGLESGVEKAIGPLGGGDKNSSVPGSGPGAPDPDSPNHYAPRIDVATPDAFYSDEYFTDEQRVEWAWNKLQQPSTDPRYSGLTILQAKHAEIKDKYPRYFTEDLVEPSENMTGDEILALQTTIHTLAAESTELSDMDRAKILAAALDNSTVDRVRGVERALARDVDQMNGIYRVSQSGGVKWESPVFRHYKPGNGYDPAGYPSKILSNMNVSGDSHSAKGNDFQAIYRFINNIPIRVDSYSAKDTHKWVSRVQEIPVGQ